MNFVTREELTEHINRMNQILLQNILDIDALIYTLLQRYVVNDDELAKSHAFVKQKMIEDITEMNENRAKEEAATTAEAAPADETTKEITILEEVQPELPFDAPIEKEE